MMFGNNEDELFSTTTPLAPNGEASENYTTDFPPRNIFQKLAIINKNSIIYKLVNFRTVHAFQLFKLNLQKKKKQILQGSSPSHSLICCSC
ncbi:unnamed protein product [Brugia pahangi]|uniref:Sema domain-containing protein n=1 Tax=Brugia pahangi TaxID=6280 RepID=A0A0N4TH13_BRUPA|nr:unnamed protein product [Brugia pahangi]